MAGHEVHLYCLDALKHNTPLNAAEYELSKYAKVYFHRIDTDIHVIQALKNLFSTRSYNVERFRNGSFDQVIRDLLSQERFDIVQMEGTYTGPYIETVRARHSGPISLRMHNVEYEIWQRLAANCKTPVKKQYLNLLAKRLKRYETKLLQTADVIVTVTPDDANHFKSLYPNTTYYSIPAGIDTEYWDYAPTSSINNWYHLGSLEWSPNVEAVNWFIHDLLPVFVDVVPNAKFHLAGKGLDRNMFPEMDALRIYEYVEDANQFVAPMDVCIVPLRSGSGIRLKILEAMAAGKLVISTTTGAQGIDCKDGEHLLIANDKQTFTDVCMALVSGQIDHMSIRKQARKLIEDKYSITAASTQLLDIYASLTHDHD